MSRYDFSKDIKGVEKLLDSARSIDGVKNLEKCKDLYDLFGIENKDALQNEINEKVDKFFQDYDGKISNPIFKPFCLLLLKHEDAAKRVLNVFKTEYQKFIVENNPSVKELKNHFEAHTMDDELDSQELQDLVRAGKERDIDERTMNELINKWIDESNGRITKSEKSKAINTPNPVESSSKLVKERPPKFVLGPKKNIFLPIKNYTFHEEQYTNQLGQGEYWIVDEFEVKNKGGGVLSVAIKTDKNWLHTSHTEIKCKEDQIRKVQIRANSQGLSKGHREKGTITLTPLGGRKTKIKVDFATKAPEKEFSKLRNILISIAVVVGGVIGASSYFLLPFGAIDSAMIAGSFSYLILSSWILISLTKSDSFRTAIAWWLFFSVVTITLGTIFKEWLLTVFEWIMFCIAYTRATSNFIQHGLWKHEQMRPFIVAASFVLSIFTILYLPYG